MANEVRMTQPGCRNRGRVRADSPSARSPGHWRAGRTARGISQQVPRGRSEGADAVRPEAGSEPQSRQADNPANRTPIATSVHPDGRRQRYPRPRRRPCDARSPRCSSIPPRPCCRRLAADTPGHLLFCTPTSVPAFSILSGSPAGLTLELPRYPFEEGAGILPAPVATSETRTIVISVTRCQYGSCIAGTKTLVIDGRQGDLMAADR